MRQNVTVSKDRNALILRPPGSPVRRFVAEPRPVPTYCFLCPFLGFRDLLRDCITLCDSSYRPDHRHAAWKEVPL